MDGPGTLVRLLLTVLKNACNCPLTKMTSRSQISYNLYRPLLHLKSLTREAHRTRFRQVQAPRPDTREVETHQDGDMSHHLRHCTVDRKREASPTLHCPCFRLRKVNFGEFGVNRSLRTSLAVRCWPLRIRKGLPAHTLCTMSLRCL